MTVFNMANLLATRLLALRLLLLLLLVLLLIAALLSCGVATILLTGMGVEEILTGELLALIRFTVISSTGSIEDSTCTLAVLVGVLFGERATLFDTIGE